MGLGFANNKSVVLAPGWHQYPAMDSSILFSLNWNSLGELENEDREYVLNSMARAMDSGKQDLCSPYSKVNICERSTKSIAISYWPLNKTVDHLHRLKT